VTEVAGAGSAGTPPAYVFASWVPILLLPGHERDFGWLALVFVDALEYLQHRSPGTRVRRAGRYKDRPPSAGLPRTKNRGRLICLGRMWPDPK